MKFHKSFFIVCLFLLSSIHAFGQLEDGSIAPDFTLTDIYGNQHNLYSYLEQGKTVYIDFFACHCPTCWNYHSSSNLSNLFDQYGPGSSSNDVFVFAIELDPNNGTNEFFGISGTTQGNWVEGTNYPQINPEGNLLTQTMNDFSVDYYPLIYAICPDKKITNIGTKTTALLYQHVSTCEPILATEEIKNQPSIQYQSLSENLKIALPVAYLKESPKLEIYSLNGQLISSFTLQETTSEVSLSFLKSGMYFLKIIANQQQIFTQKLLK